MKKTIRENREELALVDEEHREERLLCKRDRLKTLGLYEDVIDHIENRIFRLKKVHEKQKKIRDILFGDKSL